MIKPRPKLKRIKIKGIPAKSAFKIGKYIFYGFCAIRFNLFALMCVTGYQLPIDFWDDPPRSLGYTIGFTLGEGFVIGLMGFLSVWLICTRSRVELDVEESEVESVEGDDE